MMIKYKKMSDEITIEGIHGWYASIFKKLGWVVLSKDKYSEKVNQYKSGIKKWKEKSTAKLNKNIPEHIRDDINIMMQNMSVLENHVNTIFADVYSEGVGGGDNINDTELDEIIGNIYESI
jgi:hypothetical protein